MAKYNQTKFCILKLISEWGKPVGIKNIATILHLSPENSRQRLWLMWKQKYLLHKGRGKYQMGAKGRRVLVKLKRRKEISKKIGEDVSLNIRRSIPIKTRLRYKEITGTYLIGD